MVTLSSLDSVNGAPMGGPPSPSPGAECATPASSATLGLPSTRSHSGAGASGGSRPNGERRIYVRFRVTYPTTWGQELVVTGGGALLGNWDWARGTTMSCHHERDALVWEALLTLPWQASYEYRYGVIAREEGGALRVERTETTVRVLALPEGLGHGDLVEVEDAWCDRSWPESILSTAAFTRVIRPRTGVEGCVPRRLSPAVGEAVVRFKVMDWMLEEGESLCVTGAVPQLGMWQQDQMLRLTETSTPLWEGEVRLPYGSFAFTYKYAVLGTDGAVTLEVGEPRVAALPVAGAAPMAAPALVVRQDGHLRRESLWRGAGVAVPVFSLRTRRSVGCGEFSDLAALASWAASVGLRLIQVLPVNDTCVYGMWWDSYPYSSLSVHALHPQYLSLWDLMGGELPPDIAAAVDTARLDLDGPSVDYERTLATKLSIARRVFNKAGGREELDSEEYREWAAANADWLRPYAAFVLLRDLFGTSEHWRWGALADPPTPELLDRLLGPEQEHHAKVLFTCWLQWQLHRQLLAASRAAAAVRVVLKGDLPIGVDKRSVDTWMQPGLFRMDKSTGAPPDVFDPKGQNWGFPTYHWEAMAKDGYAWWRSRLAHMAQYFGAYRIDHVLGFCRIWEIPGDCSTGLMGHFRPSHPLTRRELEGQGLWDIQRLVQPYIRTHLLEELFGAQLAGEVAARFLVETSPGVYAFRDKYSSEKAIAELPLHPDSPPWLVEEVTATRRGLMTLRQNVCVLPDPDDPNNTFYPRFNLGASSSARELPDPSWRGTLARLHDDYYYHRQDALWRAHALRTLPVLLDATDMLVCGEDLGFVPACLPPVMTELGMLGLRIQRMATQPGVEFNNPATYPYLCVASPSCHDVTPLRAWWEEDADRRERFWYTMLGGGGPPPEACIPEVTLLVVQQHLNSPAALCILPIQDILALVPHYCDRPAREEVINDPTVTKHYWRYRVQVCVEDLVADAQLNTLLQDMMLASARCSPRDLK